MAKKKKSAPTSAKVGAPKQAEALTTASDSTQVDLTGLGETLSLLSSDSVAWLKSHPSYKRSRGFFRSQFPKRGDR